MTIRITGVVACLLICSSVFAQADRLRELQERGIQTQQPQGWHWGNRADRVSTWTNHSNRLVPVYTFGITLGELRQSGSDYRDAARLRQLFGRDPDQTLDAAATHIDQTSVHRLQQQAAAAGKKHLFVFVFDGMDWQTTRAAAVYASGEGYSSGRGSGLTIQDYRGAVTDFGLCVTSAAAAGAKFDVDSQVVLNVKGQTGGFAGSRAGPWPWAERPDSDYPIGLDRSLPHVVTDSASSATSIFSGIKTYNASINVALDGSRVTPIARVLQNQGYRIGIVTSVPVSHATPAAAYANNVTRQDYQDLTRDLVGLPSVAHRSDPLPGVDVLIGGGYGEGVGKDKQQGENFKPGNEYFHEDDQRRVQTEGNAAGRRYVLATPTDGVAGGESLDRAAAAVVGTDDGLIGFYGVRGGHLPFATADGRFDPTFDIKGTESYTAEQLHENPSLAEMTDAALKVLAGPEASRPREFYLMVEAGDVDWANHANNLDSSIGAVISGDAAVGRAFEWIEQHDAWDDSAVIVTADHGHFLVIDDVETIRAAR